MQQSRLKPHAQVFDEVIDKTLHVEADGKGMILSSLDHQDCAAVLDHNKEIMAAGGSRTSTFGKFELCIPELVLTKLKKKYPELKAPDMQIRVKAWKKFIRSAESKPWRVSVPRYV